MRILVVDDELVSRKKMGKILASFGDCVAVDSGEAALKAIETTLEKGEPFDLITLDTQNHFSYTPTVKKQCHYQWGCVII